MPEIDNDEYAALNAFQVAVGKVESCKQALANAQLEAHQALQKLVELAAKKNVGPDVAAAGEPPRAA